MKTIKSLHEKWSFHVSWPRITQNYTVPYKPTSSSMLYHRNQSQPHQESVPQAALFLQLLHLPNTWVTHCATGLPRTGTRARNRRRPPGPSGRRTPGRWGSRERPPHRRRHTRRTCHSTPRARWCRRDACTGSPSGSDTRLEVTVVGQLCQRSGQVSAGLVSGGWAVWEGSAEWVGQ